MKVKCCICGADIDGMRGYGQSRVCDQECSDEMEWRKTLAIMGKKYYPKPGSRWDPNADNTKGTT
jgi:hypothetical protein